MSSELINKKIGELMRMSFEEVKDTLPFTLDEIGKHGIGRVLEEVPDLLSKIIGKLMEVDAAKFINEAPEVSDKFMNVLWEGVGAVAVKFDELISVLQSERLKSVLDRTGGSINVNLEATDSPLKGHFTIRQGKISGGSGLWHFKDEDFKFFGPTEVLIKLLNGELALGFSNPKLLTSGLQGFLPLMASVMQGTSKLIKGK